MPIGSTPDRNGSKGGYGGQGHGQGRHGPNAANLVPTMHQMINTLNKSTSGSMDLREARQQVSMMNQTPGMPTTMLEQRRLIAQQQMLGGHGANQLQQQASYGAAGANELVNPLGTYVWPRTEHLALPPVLTEKEEACPYEDVCAQAQREYCESLITALQSVNEPAELVEPKSSSPSSSSPSSRDKQDQQSPASSTGNSPTGSKSKMDARGFEIVRMNTDGDMSVMADAEGEKVVRMSEELKRELATPGLLELLRACDAQERLM